MTACPLALLPSCPLARLLACSLARHQAFACKPAQAPAPSSCACTLKLLRCAHSSSCAELKPACLPPCLSAPLPVCTPPTYLCIHGRTRARGVRPVHMCVECAQLVHECAQFTCATEGGGGEGGRKRGREAERQRGRRVCVRESACQVEGECVPRYHNNIERVRAKVPATTAQMPLPCCASANVFAMSCTCGRVAA